MNKRLHKKKRVGEFKELGFELLGDLRAGISNDDIDAFVDRLVVVAEARKLCFGGGGGRDGKFEGFVTRMDACRAPDGRRRLHSSRGRPASRRLASTRAGLHRCATPQGEHERADDERAYGQHELSRA
ncbi:50S ribosome-binding protein YggL [Sorangium cellulosum]|uniref:50S ribosome-binding protein YggL n=1 Tax=Sorangium cellulosum TaxID=56 RepID=UPI000423F7CA